MTSNELTSVPTTSETAANGTSVSAVAAPAACSAAVRTAARLSALGYTIIAQAINLLVLLPTFWLLYGAPLSLAAVRTAAEQAAGAATTETLVPLAAVSLVVGTLVSSLLVTYRVTYYTSLANDEAGRTAA